MPTTEFEFRVWTFPADEDQPPEIEVWFSGLELTEPKTRTVSEWVSESMREQDMFDWFSLDATKHWQVFGKASIRGTFDCFGEYDEEIDVIEYEKREVPAEWFDAGAMALDLSD